MRPTLRARLCTALALSLLALSLLALLVLLPRPAAAQEPPTFLPLIQAPPAAGRTVVTPQAGGSVAAPGGRITLTIPPGAVREPVQVTLRPIALPPPDGLIALNLTVDVELRALASGAPIQSLDRPALLRFDARAIDAAAAKLHTLALYHASDSGWEAAATRMEAGPILVAESSTFSAWGLFARSPLAGMVGIEAAGDTIYWMDDETGLIYARSGGRTSVVTSYGIPGLNTIFEGQRADALARAPDGTFYISSAHSLRRVTPAGAVELLYERPSDTAPLLGGVAVDPRTGQLYLGGARVDLATRTLGSSPLGGGHGSIAIDAQGRIFGLMLNTSRSFGSFVPGLDEWWDLRMAWLDDPTRPAETIASGLVNARSVTLCGGAIVVANEARAVITVLEGDPPRVRGRIETPAPTLLACAGGSLWAGSAADATLIPIDPARRDPAVATAPAIDAPASLSGQGSAVVVTLAALDPVPAHHTLHAGAIPVLNLGAIDPAARRLTFFLPDPFILPVGNGAPDVAAWGALTFRAAGGAPVTAPAPALPEAANWQPWRTPQTIARGEWLVWHAPPGARTLSFSAPGGGGWTPARGDWFALRFDATGTQTFTQQLESGATRAWSVTVRDELSERRHYAVPVRPESGATIVTGGLRVTIPPGALPAAAPLYIVTVGIWPGEGPTLARGVVSNRYSLGFDPEPAALLQPIAIRLPYGPAAGGTPVAAVCGDQADLCEPIRFAVEADALTITLPPGPYHTVTHPGRERWESAAAASTAADAPRPPSGSHPRAPLNTFTGHLYWLLGLADEQWESEHFIVPYNSGSTSYQYAHDMILALEAAWTALDKAGFTMPATRINVRLLGWIPAAVDGMTPQVGTLGHWQIFLNNSMGADRLKATAAHELFHVLAQERLSLDGRAVVPAWFMEASATWAEAVAFPEVTLWQAQITQGCAFATKGLPAWENWPTGGGLTPEEQYAAAAFLLYLEQEHPGAVDAVLGQLDGTHRILAALEDVTGDLHAFYPGFALAYWGQTLPGAGTWVLTGCVTPHRLTAPSTRIEFATLPPLSSTLVKAYTSAQAGVTPPAGFAEASGTALRVAAPAAGVEIHLLAGAAPPLTPAGPGLSPLAAAAPHAGVALAETLAEHTAALPLWLLFLNRAAATAGPVALAIDAPTIASCPGVYGLPAGQEAALGWIGGGFGVETGTIVAPGGRVAGWSEQGVTVAWTPPGPGSYTAQLRHALGITSNACHFVVSE